MLLERRPSTWSGAEHDIFWTRSQQRKPYISSLTLGRAGFWISCSNLWTDVTLRTGDETWIGTEIRALKSEWPCKQTSGRPNPSGAARVVVTGECMSGGHTALAPPQGGFPDSYQVLFFLEQSDPRLFFKSTVTDWACPWWICNTPVLSILSQTLAYKQDP